MASPEPARLTPEPVPAGNSFTVRLEVLIPEEWRHRLDELAARNGQKVSALVRLALRDLIYGRGD